MRATVRIWGVLVSCALVLAGCGSSSGNTPTFAPGSTVTDQAASATVARAGHAAHVPEADWLRFDYDAQRSGVGPAATGITARNLHSLRLRQCSCRGTVDASADRAARGHGARPAARRDRDDHDLRADARARSREPVGRCGSSGPPTSAPTRAARRSRRRRRSPIPIARSSMPLRPDGRIHKLALVHRARGPLGGWPVSVTLDATHEKIAAALNISGSSLVVTTGGYIGDIPPYQGHVVMIDRAIGPDRRGVELAVLEPPPLIDPPQLVPGERLRDLGPRGGGDRAGHRPDPRRHRQRAVQRLDRLGRQRARAEPGRQAAAAQLDADRSGTAELGATPTSGAPRRLCCPCFTGGASRSRAARRACSTCSISTGWTVRTGGPGPRTGGQLQQLSSPGGDQVFTAPAVWTHAGRTYVFVGTTPAPPLTCWVAAAPRRGCPSPGESADRGTSPVIAGGLLYVYDPGGSARRVRSPRPVASSTRCRPASGPLEQPDRGRGPDHPSGRQRQRSRHERHARHLSPAWTMRVSCRGQAAGTSSRAPSGRRA